MLVWSMHFVYFLLQHFGNYFAMLAMTASDPVTQLLNCVYSTCDQPMIILFKPHPSALNVGRPF